ncbi:hypothetical protein E7W83_06720 [Cronobacter sakazakii]|nr:hypothetical protein [Cronobacter sakazakii]
MVLRGFMAWQDGGGLWHMTGSRARRFKGSAILKLCEPPFMPFGHGRGRRLHENSIIQTIQIAQS